jgi:hypothetical protein
MKKRIKAFFIATLSFKFPVSWRRGQRKRCHFAKFKSFEHPLLIKFLGLFFDVRVGVKGDVEIWFRERDAVKRRRIVRRLQRIIHNHRSVV